LRRDVVNVDGLVRHCEYVWCVVCCVLCIVLCCVLVCMSGC
jgi:hypothetical protein